MITKIESDFDFSEFMFGYTLEDINPVSTGESVKINIPELMPDIKVGKPQEKKISNTGLVFINAPDCKPKSSNKITTRNYTYAKKEYNSELSRVLKRFGNKVILPKNTKVKCKLNRKRLSDKVFTTMFT